MDILKIGQGFRKGEIFENGSSVTERKYFDFIVNGNSLEKLLGIKSDYLIGKLGWTVNIEYENKLINEFLGVEKPELISSRTSFYVCPECGDIGCGSITAKIEIKEKSVVWKDFSFENDSDEPFDLNQYKEIGPFEFDKTAYTNTIEKLRRKNNLRTGKFKFLFLPKLFFVRFLNSVYKVF